MILYCVLKIVTVCGKATSSERQREDRENVDAHTPRRVSSWGRQETGGRHTPGRCVPGKGTTEPVPASAAACQLHRPAVPASTYHRHDKS